MVLGEGQGVQAPLILVKEINAEGKKTAGEFTQTKMPPPSSSLAQGLVLLLEIAVDLMIYILIFLTGSK